MFPSTGASCADFTLEMDAETTIILEVDVENTRRLVMKKPVILVVAALALLASLPAFSQAAAYPKDAYIKSVRIEKIWTHQLGYKVQFFTSKSRIADIYVPTTWFNKGINSKADIVFGNTAEFPYFTIVWIEGKFDHITLYVQQDYRDRTWGELGAAGDLTSLFNVEDVPKEF
jgi:hypothetical protein